MNSKIKFSIFLLLVMVLFTGVVSAEKWTQDGNGNWVKESNQWTQPQANQWEQPSTNCDSNNWVQDASGAWVKQSCSDVPQSNQWEQPSTNCDPNKWVQDASGAWTQQSCGNPQNTWDKPKWEQPQENKWEQPQANQWEQPTQPTWEQPKQENSWDKSTWTPPVKNDDSGQWETPSTGNSYCSCDADTMNCGSFNSAWDAQQCYESCLASTGRDVHRLDRDGDGNACEWNK